MGKETKLCINKKLSDFSAAHAMEGLKEVGEAGFMDRMNAFRGLLEDAQGAGFKVSEALDIIYVMQSMALQPERLQSYLDHRPDLNTLV